MYYTDEWEVIETTNGPVAYVPADKKGEHLGLLATSKLREQIRTIFLSELSSALRGSSRAALVQTPVEEGKRSRWIEVALDSKIAVLHLFDVLGNHLGPTPQGGTEDNIAASQYLELGEVKVAVVPHGGLYAIKIQATGAGEADLRITEYAGADPIQILHYVGIPFGPSGQAQMILREVTPMVVLEVDEDGDDVTDRPMTPFNPPVANAGLDQTVNEGELVTLDGTKSLDPEGNPLTSQWIQTGGPEVSLSNPDSATPSFTAPQVSGDIVLTFQLVVNDGVADSDPATVTITVRDLSPPTFRSKVEESTDHDRYFSETHTLRRS